MNKKIMFGRTIRLLYEKGYELNEIAEFFNKHNKITVSVIKRMVDKMGCSRKKFREKEMELLEEVEVSKKMSFSELTTIMVDEGRILKFNIMGKLSVPDKRSYIMITNDFRDYKAAYEGEELLIMKYEGRIYLFDSY